MHLIVPLRRGLPQFVLPNVLTQLENDVKYFAISLNDVVDPKLCQSYTVKGKLMPWLSKKIIVPVDVIGQDKQGFSGQAKTLHVLTDSGKVVLTPEKFTELCNETLSPLGVDAVVAPCELVAFNDVSAGTKRSRRCVDTMATYMTTPTKIPRYIPLPGGSIEKSREVAAQNVSKAVDEETLGVYISGFEGFMAAESESNVRELRSKLAQVIDTNLTGPIAKNLPRMVTCEGSIVEILQLALHGGVTEFCVGSPSRLAARGLQLHLELIPPHPHLLHVLGLGGKPADKPADVDPRPLLLECAEYSLRDLCNVKYAKSNSKFSNVYDLPFDLTPIKAQGETIENFGRDYTQLYVHHLLNCREGLANQLLEWHNWIIMMMFFRVLRRVMISEYRDEYLVWFIHHNLMNVERSTDTEFMWTPEKYILPETYTQPSKGEKCQ